MIELPSGNTAKTVSKVFVLIVLVFVLLYILTFTSTIKCKIFPGWCEVFYSIKGQPKTGIVFGEDGLGDPYLLQRLLSDPRHAGARATMLPLDTLTKGNLSHYDLIIVDRARTMNTEKIKMFIDYANAGGNLVWIGDAGSKAENEEEYLYEDERFGANKEHVLSNAWARKYNGKVVLLDALLGVQFMKNYCNIRNETTCPNNQINTVGNLSTVDNDHSLTRAFSPTLPFHFYGKQGFALVKPSHASLATNLIVVDFGGKLKDGETEYGNNLPIVVATSNAGFLGVSIGENVFYYAIPPEYLASDDLPEKQRYYSLIGNLYYGVLYG